MMLNSNHRTRESNPNILASSPERNRLGHTAPSHGLVAQRITRLTTNQEIAGSNPAKVRPINMMVATTEPPPTEGATSYSNSQAKRVGISAAFSSSAGSVWALGIDRDGTGVSNHMIIQNGTEHGIGLHEYYLHWGQAKVVPEGILPSRSEDDALFHAAGGWAATGSSGIITYQLDDDTYLHILWDCPYNFNHYCNFIGLYLCDKTKKTPSGDLFNRMEQYVKDPEMRPEQRSSFDLVCCGPSERSYSSNGKISWGVRRPCEVMKGKYYVTMTMGDSHKTSSTVTILDANSLPNFVKRNPH